MIFKYYKPNKDNSRSENYQAVCTCCGHIWDGPMPERADREENYGYTVCPCCHNSLSDYSNCFDGSTFWNTYWCSNNWTSEGGKTHFKRNAEQLDILTHELTLEKHGHAAFSSKMDEFAITLLKKPKDGFYWSIKKTEVREANIDILENRYELKINGELLNPTQSNISKALRYVQVSDVPRSIFFALAKSMRFDKCVESISQIVIFFKKYPWFEKFYDQSLDVPNFFIYEFFRGNISSFDPTQRKPEQIIGWPKVIYKMILEDGQILMGGGVYPDTLKAMLKKYGPQNTERIFNFMVNLANYEGRNLCSYTAKLLLMDDWNLDRLFGYIKTDLYEYQGVTSYEGTQLLYDYIYMCREMSVEYDRYPRSIKLVHDIAAKNLKIVANAKNEEDFHTRVASPEYQSLVDTSGKDYIVLIPSKTTDLVHEGASLSHCVGSYIHRVIEARETICFLRRAVNPNKPLVTFSVDLDNNRIFQAKGFGNRSLRQKEIDFLVGYAKKHGLTMADYLLDPEDQD